ncbi:MAG: 2-C-methyl-D-erythritol 4-phosphate cytidylyltransferase [Longimicrobiales bacterium]|nr:2-C-methyl-D-erythritol 4-phosphate cytidylyltransferase [Longimicrobiales bacterium]
MSGAPGADAVPGVGIVVPTPRVGVAVPAAGAGRRMGGERKPFLLLDGEPLLLHALRPFLRTPGVEAVVVAVAEAEGDETRAWTAALDGRVRVVTGGATRSDSVAAAVAALPEALDVILVHDAARPLVGDDVVRRCIEAAAAGSGAVAGWPATDTLKEVDAGGLVVRTPDRERIWHAQTPQGFPAAVLRRALADPGGRARATDDAALVEAAGLPVRMVRGAPDNLKVTRPADLALAEVLLARRRAEAVTDVRAFDPSTDLESALEVARRDGILVYPTETVYGFGGRLTPAAVSAVLGLKARDQTRPLLVLVPGAEAVPGLRWTAEARALADAFWPGALTLVLADPDGAFPPGVRSPEGGVAVRRSPHPVASALVAALGEPLTSTSANAPGRPPAREGREALAAALATGPVAPVHLLDAGALPPSPPSTIVDCTAARPRVLRAGSIPVSRLRCVLPDLQDV